MVLSMTKHNLLLIIFYLLEESLFPFFKNLLKNTLGEWLSPIYKPSLILKAKCKKDLGFINRSKIYFIYNKFYIFFVIKLYYFCIIMTFKVVNNLLV